MTDLAICAIKKNKPMVSTQIIFMCHYVPQYIRENVATDSFVVSICGMSRTCS